MSRTVLVVSQRPLDLGGGGSARWSHLRRRLPEHGWRVVECSPPVGLTAAETSTDARAAHLAALRARIMGTAGRIIAPFAHLLQLEPEAFAPNNAWALTGRRVVRYAIERVRPDVVLATGPPPSALVVSTSVAAGTPTVLELRDLWAGNPFFDRGSRLLQTVEQRLFDRAEAVVTVTDTCAATLARLHPASQAKVHVLPNGFDPALLGRRSHTVDARGPAILIHAGALYGDRTAEAVVEALARPKLRGRARLELVGVVDARTERALKAHPDVEAIVEPPVSWEEAVSRTQRATIAVVINSPGTGGHMALPTKLFEALALGRPVLAITDPVSETARLLTRFGQDTGLAPPEDDGAIAAAVGRLLDDPPPPVPPEALGEFDRDRIAARYAELLDVVATRSSSRTVAGTTSSAR